MADSIGKYAFLLTADVSGVSSGLGKAKGEFEGFNKMVGGLGSSIMAGVGINIGGSLVDNVKGVFSEVAEVAGEMRTLQMEASRMNLGVEEFQKLKLAAEDAGLGVNDVGAALGKTQKAIADAFGGNADAAAALKAIGVSADDLIAKSPEEQFQAIAAGILSIENPALRAQAAMKLLGDSAPRMMPVLREVADNLPGRDSAIVSEKSVAAWAEAGTILRGAGQDLKAAFTEVGGWILQMVGLGKNAKEAADQAEREERARKKSAEHAREVAQAKQAAAEQQQREQAVIDAGAAFERSLEDRLAMSQGRKSEDLQLDRLVQESLASGLFNEDQAASYRRTMEGMLADVREAEKQVELQKKDEQERLDLQKEITAAVEETKSAEDKYADAVRRANTLRAENKIDAAGEAALIAKAQRELVSARGGDNKQAVDLAAKGSSEEYQAILRMTEQQQSAEAQRTELARRQADLQQQTVQVLTDIRDGQQERPVVSEGGGT